MKIPHVEVRNVFNYDDHGNIDEDYPDVEFRISHKGGLGCASWVQDPVTGQEFYYGTFLGREIQASGRRSLEERAQQIINTLYALLCGEERPDA